MKQIYDNKDIGETIDKSFDAGIKEGYRRCIEQMMKEAEETDLYWDGDFLAIDLNMRELGYTEHDKVRIIIVKEDKK